MDIALDALLLIGIFSSTVSENGYSLIFEVTLEVGQCSV
jgi:hypothetical protein